MHYDSTVKPKIDVQYEACMAPTFTSSDCLPSSPSINVSASRETHLTHNIEASQSRNYWPPHALTISSTASIQSIEGPQVPQVNGNMWEPPEELYSKFQDEIPSLSGSCSDANPPYANWTPIASDYKNSVTNSFGTSAFHVPPFYLN